MIPLVSAEELSYTRRGSTVLDGVTLELREGDVVTLLGPSGSGKSTLLRILLGLVAPTSGEVTIRGELASEAGRVRIPPEQRDLAVVFQDLALWPHLTVGGNLRFVLRSKRTPREEEEERIARALERVGLSGVQARYPGELSGGEQQRVAVARALVHDPAALLLDEPFANLDVHLKQELLSLLRTLFAERGVTVLHVTHDPREALQLGSTIAVLEGGRRTYAGSLRGLPSSGASSFVDAVRTAVAPGETDP